MVGGVGCGGLSQLGILLLGTGLLVLVVGVRFDFAVIPRSTGLREELDPSLLLCYTELFSYGSCRGSVWS